MPNKSKADTKANIAYGALLMKDGKPIQDAFDHIAGLRKIRPRAWFFDIVHTPNQAETAKEWRKEIVAFIKKQHPRMKEANINVELNTKFKDPTQWVARTTMFQIIYQGGAEQVKYKKTKEAK